MKKSLPTSPINLVTALACEARPLIDHFRLQKIRGEHAFNIFINQDENIRLIVSGIGNLNAAAATAYLQARAQNDCFFNVGIAGSSQHTIGECLLAHKVSSTTEDKSFYPSIQLLAKYPSYALVSTHELQEYPHDTMLDMEAFGFFTAASKLVPQEKIHIIKTISDNNEPSRKKIDPASATKLIQKNLPTICAIIETVQLKTFISSPSTAWQEFLALHHFTQYQQHQLKELCRRWEIQNPSQSPLEFCQQAHSTKEILSLLHEALEQAHYDWSATCK